MASLAFDKDLYLQAQTTEILKRTKKFKKLYLEVGGKLIDDTHAARVLPGFDPAAKLKVLTELKDKLEIIVCISAIDLERNKIRGDSGLTYQDEAWRLIDYFRSQDLLVNNVVITLCDDKTKVAAFKKQLEKANITVHIHSKTKGYPTDIERVVSKAGYGKNSFVTTTKPIVVVTAPGPSSGKMATALSQIYHEFLNGVKAGYAKYETFPVWNLPLDHPVNIAYEAATLDLMDVNLIDPFHLEAYGEQAINYNRDIETFPILKRIFNKIYGKDIYKSPTDMGVNMVKTGIKNDKLIRQAAIQEVIRRYFKTKFDNKFSLIDDQAVEKALLLMERLNVRGDDRAVVKTCRDYLASLAKRRPDYDNQAVAIECNNKIFTGKNTDSISALSAAVLNALKDMLNLDDALYLLSPELLTSVQTFKHQYLDLPHERLSLDEVLLSLNCSSVSSPINKAILSKLPELKGARVHSSYLLDHKEEELVKKLRLDYTIDF